MVAAVQRHDCGNQKCNQKASSDIQIIKVESYSRLVSKVRDRVDVIEVYLWVVELKNIMV